MCMLVEDKGRDGVKRGDRVMGSKESSMRHQEGQLFSFELVRQCSHHMDRHTVHLSFESNVMGHVMWLILNVQWSVLTMREVVYHKFLL